MKQCMHTFLLTKYAQDITSIWIRKTYRISSLACLRGLARETTLLVCPSTHKNDTGKILASQNHACMAKPLTGYPDQVQLAATAYV